MKDLHNKLREAKTSQALRLLTATAPIEQDDKLRQRRDAIDPSRHRVNDPHHRPDKHSIVDIDGDDPMSLASIGGNCYIHQDQYGERKALRIDKVNRIALALQRRIVGAAVSFTFGNPVIYNASPEGEEEQRLYERLQSILRQARISSHDRRMARALYTYAQVAELWYSSEGTEPKAKLRCKLLSPAGGDSLYPLFDEYGDMIAFTRGYTIKAEGGEATSCYDCYTEQWLYRWTGEEMAEGYPKPNPLGKIPVIYAEIERHDTAEVDSLIDRLETLLSNFSDTNDYHASPKIFVTGELQGFSKRGEAGAIIEGDKDARAEYLSWSSAPEAVRLEIDTLLRMIYNISQTPDISFDSVKGLGAMSGTALKLLFMDAHLKVQERREVLDEYLSRRVSLILSYLHLLEPALRGAIGRLEVEPEITPYIISSDAEDLDYWLKAGGNKPLISHEEAIVRAGLSHDAGATLRALQQEAEASMSAFASQATPIDE